MDENGNTQDLLQLLTSVCKHVGYGFQSYDLKNPEFHDLKQMPCIISTLTKKLIFAKKGEMPISKVNESENLASENQQFEISHSD